MMLTTYFLQREIRKLSAYASERPHKYRSMKDIQNIFFICNAKDWDIGRACVEKLKAMNKTVNTALYVATEKDVPTWYSNYLLFRIDSDVNIWGIPTKSVQQQFNRIPADLIIDFAGEKSPAMYYLMLKHPATFKAGIKRSESTAYDFTIIPPEENDTIPYLFEQLLNYLQSIASKT